MQFLSTSVSFTALLACVTTALAQSVVINQVNGTVARQGLPYTFELDRPSFQSSGVDVAVAVGFQSCASGSCFPIFGDVVYNGIYRPVNDPNPLKRQNQNITVTIPSGAPSGNALLTVTHFALVGAVLEPWVDTSNASIILL